MLIFKRGESVMVFSSASFLIFFLPCLLVLYFLVPRRCRYLRNLVLLAFSLAMMLRTVLRMPSMISSFSRT